MLHRRRESESLHRIRLEESGTVGLRFCFPKITKFKAGGRCLFGRRIRSSCIEENSGQGKLPNQYTMRKNAEE